MTKPLQVYVDDADLVRLERWASKRGWTKSDAIRAAIRALVRSTEEQPDPLLDLSGMIQSGLPSDASGRFDECLDETFVAAGAKRYRRRAPIAASGRKTRARRARR